MVHCIQSTDRICWPTYPTFCKVTSLVLGVLALISAALVMHFYSANAHAVYISGGVMGPLAVFFAVTAVLSCSCGKRGKEEVSQSRTLERQESKPTESTPPDERSIEEEGLDDVESIESALAEGKNPDLGRALFRSVQNGDSKLVAFLLEKGVDPQQVDSRGLGEALLFMAITASYGRNKGYAIAQLLLAKCQDLVKCRASQSGETPLHWAAWNPRPTLVSPIKNERAPVDFVRLLLQHGGDVGAQDNAGNTPLHTAAKGICGIGPLDMEVIRVLIQYGAKNSPNFEGKTPLQIAEQFPAQHKQFEEWVSKPPSQEEETKALLGGVLRQLKDWGDESEDDAIPTLEENDQRQNLEKWLSSPADSPLKVDK